MEEVCGPEADTGIAISKGRHKPSPDISMTAAEGKEKGIEGTSGGEDQGDGSANGSSAGQAEQAPTTEMMQLDVKGDVGNESIGGDKVSDQGDLRQVEMSDTPVDPALQNQGVPEPPKENGVAEPTPDSTLDISSAASLISLAGGAFQYLSAQNASAQHVGTNGTAWPSSPESPNKTFNGHSQLPSMMGQNSSPSSRDGKHTTLPSLGSIEVLADLATKQGDSPQQGWKGPRAAYPQVQANLHISPSNRPPTTVQSPGLPLPPTPASSEGTPRPSMQYQTVEQRRTFIPNEQQHAPFGYYAPIKDTSASPQPPYTTPDSANLFAARGGFSPATTDGRRPSTSSEFQYNSDHTATTPRGPSTCDTMASSSTEDGLVAQPPPPAPAPRSRGHSSALPPGGFKCEFEGCKAPPFQTQYLLNSHANVHSSVRPHYCPVKGCPRGEGGKGFKRKNEMIRHGLVHSSPGYICPFCPDREHKYPRPDNLQRHVRVHHMDKDKDDPQLREVLSQRPEGVNRGRRRRMASTS